MHIPDLLILLILIAGAAASAHWKKLTRTGAITGAVIGWVVYIGDGYPSLILLALFFILGTAATAWKKKEKQQIKGHAAHQTTRTAGQVIANGGIAGLLGILAFFLPAHKELLGLMLAASLSSATADTLSSEGGMVYGRRHFNILTGKREEKGLDGVISLEGLGIGVLGSSVIALAWLIGRNSAAPAVLGPAGWTATYPFFVLILAGLVGNLADSVLGATLERKGSLSNDAVNLLNTAIAAGTAAALIGFRDHVSG